VISACDARASALWLAGYFLKPWLHHAVNRHRFGEHGGGTHPQAMFTIQRRYTVIGSKVSLWRAVPITSY